MGRVLNRSCVVKRSVLCVLHCCRYTDQQLDREFIEVLRETCFKLVERQEVRRCSNMLEGWLYVHA